MFYAVTSAALWKGLPVLLDRFQILPHLLQTCADFAFRFHIRDSSNSSRLQKFSHAPHMIGDPGFHRVLLLLANKGPNLVAFDVAHLDVANLLGP